VVLLSNREDLSHNLDVEAVRFGFAEDVLDIAGKRLLLLFEALDAFDEGAQMAGVDFVCPGLDRLVCFSHAQSRDLAHFEEGDRSPQTALRVKLRARIFPGHERSSSPGCRNPLARAIADPRGWAATGGRCASPTRARPSSRRSNPA
jgi:hypothetical protein